MALNFIIKKKNQDNFTLDIGIPLHKLENEYKKEYFYLKQFLNDEGDFYFHRNNLCDVLDNCFDHFTEETLINLTKVLNQPSETTIKHQIIEKSVSKRPKHQEREKQEKQREKQRQEEEQRRREQEEQRRREQEEQRRREQEEQRRQEEEQRRREEEEQRRREEEEQRRREQDEQRRREEEEQRRREQEEQERRLSNLKNKKQKERELSELKYKKEDLNYEILPKHEIMKLLTDLHKQIENIESYVKNL